MGAPKTRVELLWLILGDDKRTFNGCEERISSLGSRSKIDISGGREILQDRGNTIFSGSRRACV